MAAERPLNVVFFGLPGDEPVRKWLKDLPDTDRKTIGEDLLAIQFRWPVGMPWVRPMGNGLWELRSRLKDRISRVFFSIVDEEIVLLHGFIKKEQKTPAQDLELALKRKRQYLEEYEET